MLKTKVKISPLFFAILTAFLAADKSGIAFSAIAFSAIHEATHFAALFIFRVAFVQAPTCPIGRKSDKPVFLPHSTISKITRVYMVFCLFVLFCFLGPYPQRMEVPRLGVESK